MHALGFLHEHVRPDRDAYVKINAENIRFGKEHQFAIMNEFDWFDMSSVGIKYSAMPLMFTTPYFPRLFEIRKNKGHSDTHLTL